MMISVRHHSSSIRHISPIDSIRLPLPASRFTTTGTPRSSRVTSTRCCTLRARSLSALFRVPRSDFRVCSRFKVDQRVASFGEARPRLHLDHVIQVRALEPELDFLGGAREGAPPPGPRGGARVPREQLQLRGARRERRELDGEPLHRADGRRLLEPRLERRGDTLPVGGGIFEGRLDQPRRAVLELGARAPPAPPPPCDAGSAAPPPPHGAPRAPAPLPRDRERAA